MSGTIGDARKRRDIERTKAVELGIQPTEAAVARRLAACAETCKAAGYRVVKLHQRGDYGLDNGRGGQITGGPPVPSVPETRIPLWVATEEL